MVYGSLSLAGGRRACPALKPDAADQVLLKNRAGFAAFSKGRTFHRCREQDRCAGDREAGSLLRRGGTLRWVGTLRWAMPVSQDAFPRLIPLVISLAPRILLGFLIIAGSPIPCAGPVALRVLSSRSAAGYARRGISLLMLLHCRFSRVRVVFSMFSLLHFGFGPRCSSRYARRRTGGRTGRVSIRIFGCTCRGMRGLASAVASAVDCPDSSRL